MKRVVWTKLTVALLCALCILAVFTAGPAALADNDEIDIEDEEENDDIVVIPSNANALLLMDVGAESPKGAPGDIVTVVLPMAVNREYLPSDRYMLRNITVEPDIPTDGDVSKWPFDIINASYVRHLDDMSYHSTADVYYNFRISEFATEGVYPINFTVSATVWREDAVNGTSITEDVEFELCVWLTVVGNGALSGVTTDNGPIRMTETTGGGVAASPGEKVTLPLSLMNYGGALTNLTIEPVISTDLDEFPFVASETSYVSTFGSVPAKGALGTSYEFTVSPYATTGNKVVTFKAAYTENGKAGECTFTANIYIKNGYEDIPTTAPSLMVAGYSLTVNDAPVSGLMAGDDAVLTLTIKNNAAYDTSYKNAATLTLPDTKTLAFTVGGSDSAYVRAIAPGKTGEFTYRLSVRDDAEVGIATVSVTTTYETGDAVAGKAVQAITIPVSQPMDVVVGEPVVYGTPTVDSPFSIGLTIINMSRAKALNLQVMATDGLSMAESYYGGDLLAGGTLDADVLVNSNQVGEFDGTLIVAYEDANGERYTQKVTVPLVVSEAVAEPEENAEEEAAPFFRLWMLWPALGLPALIAAGAILLPKLRRRKRAAEKAAAASTFDFTDGWGA